MSHRESLSTAASQPFTRRIAASLNASVGATLSALVLSIFAFRALSGFDPGRGVTTEAGALFVPSDTAPGFVYGLILFILYMRHRKIARALREARPSPWGIPLILVALPAFAWTRHTGALDLELLVLIPWLLGCAFLLGGRRLAGLLALPTLLLVFAYPMPAIIANHLVWDFQRGTARLVTAILNTVGVAALNEGDVIYTRGYVFEVIETCSGLRITETLLLSSFAYQQMLCNSRRHLFVLVLLSPLLGYLWNAVRVLMIIATPHSFLAGDHTLQGLIVIVLGVFSLAGVDSLLHRFRILEAPKHSASARAGHKGGAANARLAWSAALFAGVLCLLSFGIPAWTWTQGRPLWQLDMPTDFDGWTSKKIEDDETFLGSVGYVRSLHRGYERGSERVEAFLAMDDRLLRDRSLFSPKHELPGAAWEVLERRSRALPFATAPAQELLVHSIKGDEMVWQWYEGADSFSRELARQALALDNSFLRRSDDVYVYRVSTPIDDRLGGRLAAEARLQAIGERLSKALPRSANETSSPPS